jgi:hypothetical protein
MVRAVSGSGHTYIYGVAAQNLNSRERQRRIEPRIAQAVLKNGFLKYFLTDAWADEHDNGNAEDYLGQFTFKTGALAERLAAWMGHRFDKNGFGPEAKFEIEIIEAPKGKFRVVASPFFTRADVPNLRGRLI